jgi:hypothetical protein
MKQNAVELAGWRPDRGDGFLFASTWLQAAPPLVLTMLPAVAVARKIPECSGGWNGCELDLENRCQVVTTAGKAWASILLNVFPHGEPGAIAVIDPPLESLPTADPPPIGPVYFSKQAEPDPLLTSTSVDGGIVYLNMLEGEYTITATKANVEFATVRVKARPGIIVNASPPYEVKGDQWDYP